ncbi:hypothetical protein [Hyphomicrobium sp. 99]|uniref:hypothetical protein n=1 Tax=Hyphomicrobium sp. 99 TaxID=1163419 RepID=UPI0005F853CD|nr:hypothetical protein [Hyphomicrobium sp. 99]
MLDVPVRKSEGILARAWTITFEEGSDLPDVGSITITQPRNLIAVMTELETDQIRASMTSVTPGALTIVCLPLGVNYPKNIEHDAEAWMRDAAGQTVRAGVRTVRVFCAPDRALIYAASDHIQSVIDAVVRFTVAQRETNELEKAMSAAWSSIDADVPLTRSVTRHQKAYQRHMDEMNELSARMRAKHLRICRALEQLDTVSDELSRRIFSELVLAGALYERVEELEDPIEFALDQYEIANTKLFEEKNAAKEQRTAMIGHFLEAGIIVLLLLQLPFFK